jgi:hypothetical protein
MSEQQDTPADEISTRPDLGVVPSEKLATLPSTSSPLVAALWAFPLLARPLAAWACIAMAATSTIPKIWPAIELASKGCGECGIVNYTGAFIYTGLTAFLCNPKVMKDAAGVVGAATSFVTAMKSLKTK